MRSVEKTGKTVDAAVFSALEELGATIDEVIVEVLDEGESGILGLGRKPARVLVSLDRIDEADEAEPYAEAGEADGQYRYDRKAVNAASDDDPGMFDRAGVEQATASSAAREDYYGDDGEEDLAFEEERARLMDYYEAILDGMDIRADISCKVKDGGIRVEIEGEDVGALIGRRGDTLNALHYLGSLVLNHSAEQRMHFSLDVSGYRKRREQALQALAKRTAGRVMKVRKEYVMEEMNAAERRIIHATLQSHRGVRTVSEGSEPHRYVVVVPLKDGEVKEDFAQS